MMAGSDTDWLCCMKTAALRMLDDDTIIDVKFVFPRDDIGKIPLVRAHKFVLMARSNVFHEMFKEPGLEYVDVDDIEPEVFELMIRYLYTDEMDLTTCNALPLLHAALKYNIPKLIVECWEYLSHTLTKWNVTLILDMAVDNKQKNTVASCLNFLRYGGPESFASLKRHHISKDTLEVVLNDDKSICDELDLFVFCDRWAGIECGRRDRPNSPENKREVLGELLYQIRLPTLRTDDLIGVVAKSGLLTEAELSKVLNNNKPNSINDANNSVPKSEVIPGNPVPSSGEDTNVSFPSSPRSTFPITCNLVDIDEESEVFEINCDVDWLFHGFVTRREKRLSFKEAYFQYEDISTRMMSKTIGEYSHHFCVQTTEFQAGEKIDMFVKKNASQVGIYPSSRCGYSSSKEDPDVIQLYRPEAEGMSGMKIKVFNQKYSVCGLIFSVRLDKCEQYFNSPGLFKLSDND